MLTSESFPEVQFAFKSHLIANACHRNKQQLDRIQTVPGMIYHE